MTEDRCRVCGALIGFGIPLLHLGLCDDCRADAPESDAVAVRQATSEEQHAALVAWARGAVAHGAGHDCEEWWTDGRCALCGELKPHDDR